MTIFLRGKNHLISRFKNLAISQRFNHSHNRTLFDGDLQTEPRPKLASGFLTRQSYILDTSKWRKVSSTYAGIRGSMIPDALWVVLKRLRSAGYESYLVGGCVRDLILNRIPKDFDVITTASLKQIKKKFNRCIIVGQRFPICIVRMKGAAFEVSSFATAAEKDEEKEKFLFSQMPVNCDEKDFRRWRNSMRRDFTVNSLFFDPFANQIYDYANGMLDLRFLKLRTLIPAHLSFEEDSARILRGLRVAGRLGLSISKDIETAIYKLSSSIFNLPESRLMMELNYMLSYGAAESTICLLQRFKLLETLLPFHAAYLGQQACKESAQSSTMLMKLFSNLDRIVSTDRPCDCRLWVGLLAFHQALVINPQDAFVIWAFASVLYHGTWKGGVKFARENAKLQVKFEPEITGSSEFNSDEELAEKVSQLVSLVQDAADALVDGSSLSKSMARYPDFPCHGYVFIKKKIGNYVAQLVDVLANVTESNVSERYKFTIDYELLGKGDLHETRFALGKVILGTLSCDLLEYGIEIIKGKPGAIQQNSDALKDSVVYKTDRKRMSLPFEPEQNQKVGKKEKLIQMKCFSNQEISMEEKGVILKDESDSEALNTMPLSILEKEKKISQWQEVSDKGANERYTGMVEKLMRSKAENMEHCMLNNEEAKHQSNVMEQCHLSKHNKNKQEGVAESGAVLQEIVKGKTEKASSEEETCRPSLYSLFK